MWVHLNVGCSPLLSCRRPSSTSRVYSRVLFDSQYWRSRNDQVRSKGGGVEVKTKYDGEEPPVLNRYSRPPLVEVVRGKTREGELMVLVVLDYSIGKR